ncbi:Hint domain-containing protein [Rhodobacter ferrooxidans]|uniref:Hedgehog/Intein (Hint) domain-containing protein n=1 Tax=Rhodobacter ferrooxidans TaxID=371731 RepID=C8S2U0_9RHOB|nr:Hint domain-containing protein [Rhodobacter sp. SW2]EEW24766.1 conserved hypothetical protein [Rhodobacter sp. SW2]
MSNSTLGRTAGEACNMRPIPDLPGPELPGLSAGTKVLTLAGVLPVEYLCPGDRIVTRDGARTLRDVHVRVVQDARMICISASALGIEQPEDDVLITPDQPILIRDWRARALKGADQALVRAENLVDGEYIYTTTLREQRLFVLEFDTAAVIYAGGLELACTPALAEV